MSFEAEETLHFTIFTCMDFESSTTSFKFTTSAIKRVVPLLFLWKRLYGRSVCLHLNFLLAEFLLADNEKIFKIDDKLF